MKALLITLLLVFGGISALYTRFKRVNAESGTPQDGYDPQSFVGEEPDMDDNFFGFDEKEADEVVNPQSEYFTYETPVEDIKVESKAESKTESVAPEVVEESSSRQFDLRQAVIYQTLLNNRYINVQNQIIQ
jgi:hypothetical protein